LVWYSKVVTQFCLETALLFFFRHSLEAVQIFCASLESTEANIPDLFEIIVGLFYDCSRVDADTIPLLYPTSAQVCAYYSRVERERRALGCSE